MKTITKLIYDLVAAKLLSQDDAITMLKELQDRTAGNNFEIAVIGMAGKFPKAADLNQYWYNLINGINCIDVFPDARGKDWQDLCAKSLYARLLSKNSPEQNTNGDNIFVKGGYLNEVDKFDAAFFKISPKEAMYMDPLQRIFLETVYEAMEDAGYGGQKLYGSKAGVFAGKDHTHSTMYKYVTEPNEMQLTGNWAGILASRISYIFNFRGPSMVVDTACSSGLVAVYEACRAINNKECDLAIAGGIQVAILADKKGVPNSMEMVESSDEHVRTFDKDASGTVWGEGAGVLILKPLDKAIADRDHIHAVIKGGAINNDGASSGITAPNAEAQKELLIKAWKEAKIDPETISYIETHGTGTKLGDPIEIKGITAAFEEFTNKKQFCGIGSVKTNVGHLVAASGLASAIKVILALKNKEIPPSINFNSPNPYINFLHSPVYVNDRSRPWDSMDGLPRRAGVSAFGFSGTNCHVILEEAPAFAGGTSLPQNLPGILTISARNKNALQELITRYDQFLEQNPEADLGNICYTANTGRGHYNYRLALIVANLEDLKQKITRLKAAEPGEIREAGIFYGEYKIVPDHKTDLAENEITENERRRLNTTASQKLKEYILTESDMRFSAEYPEFAAGLCRLYIQGADIAWDELYQDQGFRKISLPVYPLERIKCWAPPNNAEISGIQMSSKPIHPLLHTLLADSLDLKIYTTEFTVDKQWVLNEHRVLNYYIAPGTTYLEMARVAAEAFYDNSPFELRDFLFVNPLVVDPGEKKEVQTIVKKESEYLEFVVATPVANSLGDKQWTIHARGKIYRVRSGEIARYDLAELKEKLDVERNRIEFPESTGTENIIIGPRWRNIISGAGKNGQALLQFKLPDEFVDDLHDYGIHPALMDQAADAFSQSIEGMRLPLMYKRMTVYGRMPASFYCYMRRKDQGTGNLETILLDATLMDESGQVFIEIEDYSLKKVKDRKLNIKKATAEILYYSFTWLPEKLKTDALPTDQGSILIFKDETGIADRIMEGLKREGRDLIEVEPGSGYEQITDRKFRITGEESGYRRLVDALKDQRISQIIHLMSIVKETGRPESLTELEEKQSKGLYSLFYLSRALAGYNCRDGIDLVLIADNVNEVTKTEDSINPAPAALFGLGKTVFSENDKLRCRVIDIDHHTTPDNIVLEILSPGSVYQVAYRHNQRYIEELQTVELQKEPGQVIKDSASMRAGGVYIITGGTGGVGMEIGKYMTGKAKITLALINRTAMPGRESWDEILTRNEDQKLQAKIAAIREMEQAGSEVLIFSADVSSESSLKPVLDGLRSKYGRINGVIHAAGIAGAGFMIKKDIQTFKNVVTPKIQGTWLLDKLTGTDDLDFFIMFSSIVTITGGPGQSDYNAANSYLDAYAAYRNKQGKKTISINWPLWEETGMAADYGVTGQKLIFKPVPRNNALDIFEEILAYVSSRDRGCSSRIIFGELNYSMITAVNTDLPFQLSERISAAIKRQKTQVAGGQADSASKNFPKAKLIGINSQDEGQTVYIMAQIWARVLGLAEIDVHQNFYDMGGDSILAGQLFNAIDFEYPEVINISDIFTYSSIVELSKYIDEKGGFKHPGTSGSKDPADLPIQPLPHQEFYPMSSAQKRMFILHQIEGANLSYNTPFVLLVEGKLDRQRLEEAFQELIRRQECLRTTFETVNGEPVQRIHPAVEFSVSYQETDESQIREIIDDFVRPFDLNRAPLLRVGLFKISDTRYVLIYDLHHIVSDGFSVGILMNEFIDLYEGKNLPNPQIHYKDFAAWQNEVFRSPKIKNQEEYWLQTFSGELPQLNLPLDYPRPAIQSFEGDRVEFEIGPELTGQTNRIAALNGATLYMVLLAAYNVLLFKYTGQDDIIIGSPVAGRSHLGLEKIIGVFINTLAMRNYPAGNKNFSEFLAQVKENSLKAFDNQEYQFEVMIDKLNLRRDLSRNPIFDVMFVLQNMDIVARESMGLRFIPFPYTHKAAKFDLALEAIETEEQKILCNLEYCTKLFKQETIIRLTRHFINILTAVTANPSIQLKDLEILSREEKEQILKRFNDTRMEYRTEKLIHELFEEQAARTPEAIALQFKNETLTYRELNEQAGRLAGVLQGHGVKPNKPVAIMVNRSLEMITGIMAIMKAGGAYLPIDPEYPGERIKYMLEDSETEILLTRGELTAKVQFSGIMLDLNEPGVFRGNGAGLSKENTARDAAYIIYTSGSTGHPKGVIIEHQAVHNFIRGIMSRIDFAAGKTILALTTISFDIFGLETLLALAGGLKIVIASEKEQLDPKLLSEVIIQNRIDMLQITPSRLQLLLSDERYRPCFENLTEIMIGGEALPENLLDEVRKLTRAKIYNMYGPTETTIWSTVKDLTAETAVNIGTPIANTQIYIVDPNNHPQPVGVIGELCIAGDGLARGYWKRPELTAGKFVPNPFRPGERMYRTGDTARWLQNGNIEFLGRIDYQVKIRGYRIELGEIENRLLQHEAIQGAVVIDRADDNGLKSLHAYFVASRKLTAAELREYMEQCLPDYMIPASFSQLERIPQTPSGKIDRKALPKADRHSPDSGVEYVAPQTVIEKQLATVWQELLKTDRVGTRDNFFNLGGNSLLVVLMHNRLNGLYSGKVDVTDIFAYPTIARLAQFIETGQTAPMTQLEELPFPEEYFGTAGKESGALVFKFQIDGTRPAKLKNIADRIGVGIPEILLATYCYLLAEISEQPSVVVQTILADANHVFPLKIELSEITALLDLFQAVKQKFTNISKNAIYDIQQFNKTRVTKNKHSIIPFFANGYDLTRKPLAHYDLMWNVKSITGDEIRFTCHYNKQRLKQTQVEKLIRAYLKSIEIVIERLEGSDQV